MADENKEGAQAPALTEIEQRASNDGWVPEDQWEGDPADWRPAKEFLDRGELFKKIDAQNRTIKEFKKALDDMARLHGQVREAEYKRAKEELLLQKKDALLEQDVDKVIMIDERLQQVREAEQQVKLQQAVKPNPTLNPIFVQWTEKNQWYNTNEAMRAYADTIGNQLGASGGWDPEDLLVEVERRVKKEFAHKFENPRRREAAAVEGSAKSGGKVKEVYELTADERKIMNRLVKVVPGMTEEKYIADLKKIKEMK